MNDACKTNIKTKIEAAINAEGINTASAGRFLGIDPTYLSMMKNIDSWKRCPNSAWETVLIWVNSGQTLTEYSQKHGKVLPEKHEPKPGTVISRIIDVKPAQEIKPQPEPKKTAKSDLVDMLKNERVLLNAKVEAIDLLLKHYTE